MHCARAVLTRPDPPHPAPPRPTLALWQGLGDDSIECVRAVLGAHITELSLAGCTQLSSKMMQQFDKQFPCLHTLNVRKLAV